MAGIKIESGIPLPTLRADGVTETLRRMAVGDSILLSAASRNGISALAARVQIKVATRKINDKQVRVWRTA